MCLWDRKGPGDSPDKKSEWPTNPANHKNGMTQVPADRNHYYFAAGHMLSTGCPDCYRLFRINLDGSGLFQMEGAVGHGAAVSPLSRVVWALAAVAGSFPYTTFIHSSIY